IGRRWNDTMPPAVSSRARASVMKRWCSANATTRAIMTSAFLGPPRARRGWHGLRSGGPPAWPAAIQRRRSGARRRAGEGGGDGSERPLGRLDELNAGDDLGGGIRRRRRRGQVGDGGADEEDDVVVVAVVPESRDPRRVHRARERERRQRREGEKHQQRDERPRLHAAASDSGGPWPPPSHA